MHALQTGVPNTSMAYSPSKSSLNLCGSIVPFYSNGHHHHHHYQHHYNYRHHHHAVVVIAIAFFIPSSVQNRHFIDGFQSILKTENGNSNAVLSECSEHVICCRKCKTTCTQCNRGCFHQQKQNRPVVWDVGSVRRGSSVPARD